LGTKVPEAWSTDYHSPEYFSPEYGDKNQIGAFFFYPNEQTARNVLGVAVRQQESKGHSYPNNVVTACHTTADINLLDITNCQRPVNILNILYDEGIDVLTTDFYKYLDDMVPFNRIRGHHQFIINNEGSNDRMVKSDMKEYGVQIDQFFHYRVQYIGQLLTDFGNGITFKRQLQENGFEGYQFMEEKDCPTICIFEADKLSVPFQQIA
jgi:hypothetical protein